MDLLSISNQTSVESLYIVYFLSVGTNNMSYTLCSIFFFCAIGVYNGFSQVEDTPSVCEVCRCQYLENNSVAIDCSFNDNISSIPDIADFQRKVISLNMASCRNFTSIKPDSFKNYTYLQKLDLHNTSLQFPPRNSSANIFEGLRGLQFLDLSGNEKFPITSNVHPDLFLPMVSLKQLRIHGTTGTYQTGGYPDEALSKLPRLEILWLDGRQGAVFGPAFQNLTTLATIRISGDKIIPPWRSGEFCKLQDINADTVKNLIHVKNLLVVNCGVKKITTNALEGMANLTRLDLSSNTNLKLSNIFKALGNVNVNIETLVLNSVEDAKHMDCGVRITKDMAKPLVNKRIKTIHLENNKIISLDKGVFEVLPSTLEYVHINRNKLQAGMYIFHAFNLKGLKSIDFSYNYFYQEFSVNSNIRNREHTNTKGEIVATAHGNSEAYGQPLTEAEHRHLYHRHKKCPDFSSVTIPPGVITVYLPPRLEKVILSYSKMAIAINELFAVRNNSIRTIHARKCLLMCWQGPVHGIPLLEDLDLSFNDCTYVNVEFFSEFPNLRKLDISQNLLFISIANVKNGLLFQNNNKLQTLNMTLNHIQCIPFDFFKHTSQLQELILSNNQIRELNFSIAHMRELRTLDLRNNRIVSIAPRMVGELTDIAKSQRKVKLIIDLENNIVDCSCKSLLFFRLALDISGSDQLLLKVNVCRNDSGTYRINSIEDLEMLVYTLEKQCPSYINTIVFSIIVIVVFCNITIGTILYKHRWKIFYWYYVRRNTNSTNTNSAASFRYHVFLAYVEEARQYAVQTVGKRIQSLRPNFKIFLQLEDSVPGQENIGYIGNTVHASNVVVFIVSKNCWTNSEWNVAMRMAHEESLHRGDFMFVGIMLDFDEFDSEIPEAVAEIKRRRQLLYYPGDEDSAEEFWNTFIKMLDRAVRLQNNASSGLPY